MSLNRSRSKNITDTALLVRSACVNARRSRSSKRRRLQTPVRESCWAAVLGRSVGEDLMQEIEDQQCRQERRADHEDRLAVGDAQGGLGAKHTGNHERHRHEHRHANPPWSHRAQRHGFEGDLPGGVQERHSPATRSQ